MCGLLNIYNNKLYLLLKCAVDNNYISNQLCSSLLCGFVEENTETEFNNKKSLKQFAAIEVDGKT